MINGQIIEQECSTEARLSVVTSFNKSIKSLSFKPKTTIAGINYPLIQSLLVNRPSGLLINSYILRMEIICTPY